jgi:hypothetical protein
MLAGRLTLNGIGTVVGLGAGLGGGLGGGQSLGSWC